MEFHPNRCRIGRMELCFDREFEFGVFMMGKRLKIACFAVWAFSYYQCIPTFLEKNRATSPPEFRTHPFSTVQYLLPHGVKFLQGFPHGSRRHDVYPFCGWNSVYVINL